MMQSLPLLNSITRLVTRSKAPVSFRTLARVTAAFLLCIALVSPVNAQLNLSNIFGDHMVIQRDKPVRIWGQATANQAVALTFGDQNATTRADANGDWLIELKPMKASFQPRVLTVKSAGQSRTVKDILIGEVWLCGGQSNMEWSLRSTTNADLELAAVQYPAIRFIRLPKIANIKPQDDFPVKSDTDPTGNWRLCIPEQAENITGVGYYFAQRLRRQLRVPVGLIDTSWGGTMAQHWTTKKTLAAIPEMKPYIESFEGKLKAWNEGGKEQGAKNRFEADTKAWELAAAKAKKNNERIPGKPNPRSYTDPANHHQPGGMINGCIYPIAKFALRGVLFYQGENNSFGTSWKPYPKTCPAVISDWRKLFKDENLPFGSIQIAGWSTRRSMTYDMNHHCNIVREVQFNTWKKTSNTGLIVTFDTNSNGSIHPGNKTLVGERSARWALAQVYKVTQANSSKPLEWKGPAYQSYKIDGEKVIISFDKTTNRGLRLDQDVDVGFYIAGKDKVFHHAKARITRSNEHGDQLVVWHDQIKEPLAVRYAFSNLPMGGLMNARELPAYPFRTDNWPITPHQSTGSYQASE